MILARRGLLFCLVMAASLAQGDPPEARPISCEGVLFCTSHSGNYAMTLHHDGTVRILHEGDLTVFEVPTDGLVDCIAISDQGEAAFGVRDQGVITRAADESTVRLRREREQPRVEYLGFHPKQLLVTAYFGGILSLRSGDRWSAEKTIRFSGGIGNIEFSGDDEDIVFGASGNGLIAIGWRDATINVLTGSQWSAGDVLCIAPKGATYVADTEGLISRFAHGTHRKIYRYKSSRKKGEEQTVEQFFEHWMVAIAVSDDGKQLCWLKMSGVATIYDLENGKIVKDIVLPAGSARTIEYSRKDGKFMSANAEGKIFFLE